MLLVEFELDDQRATIAAAAEIAGVVLLVDDLPRSTSPAVDQAGDLKRAAIAVAAVAGVVLLSDDLAVEVVTGGELGVLPFYARPAAAREDCAAAANGRRWFASGARPIASSTAIQRAPHA